MCCARWRRSPDSYIAEEERLVTAAESDAETPADLATNKASAAADRREPRYVVDLVTIHEGILPLGAVVCAAVGRFPGLSPEEMLAEITRHSRFTAEEFRALATERPLDIAGRRQRRLRVRCWIAPWNICKEGC
jgi:hypothetical protein